MKGRMKGWWLPIGVGIVLVVMVGSLIVNAVLAVETHTIVSQHNADLAKIKQLQQRLATDEHTVVGYAGYISNVFNVFCTEIRVSCPAPPKAAHP